MVQWRECRGGPCQWLILSHGKHLPLVSPSCQLESQTWSTAAAASIYRPHIFRESGLAAQARKAVCDDLGEWNAAVRRPLWAGTELILILCLCAVCSGPELSTDRVARHSAAPLPTCLCDCLVKPDFWGTTRSNGPVRAATAWGGAVPAACAAFYCNYPQFGPERNF